MTTLPTAYSLFRSELTSEEKDTLGAEQAGMIRTMADFTKGAYNLNHVGVTENPRENDIAPHATDAYKEIIGKGWTPLNLLSTSPILDGGTIQDGMLNDGFYINGNAAACVARCGDAIVLSFRGTNDNGKDGVTNPYDPDNTIHQDEDQWTDMPDYYELLSPLISAFDAYVAANGISKIYVTGHSMGGSMALEYMSHHPGNEYQAVTFAATPFGQPNWLGISERKDYSPDSRITQIEIEKDTAVMLYDQPNLLGNTNSRPGRVIDFGGNQTLYIDQSIDNNHVIEYYHTFFHDFKVLDYWGITSNHSMDYYRQITDSVDADSWTRILAGTDTKTVLLGGELVTDTFDFIVDGQLSGTNTSKNNGNNYLSANTSSLDFKVIYGGKGNDTLWAGTNNTSLLGGTGDDYLYGNIGNDTLIGGSGNDWLIGGSGSDLMEGGAGSDGYYVDSTGDTITESSAQTTEIDQVYSAISYTLTAHLENLSLIGINLINGNGNSLNNLLNGNSAANILNGYSGVDRLFGGAGNDTLNGGSGADSMSGGDGNDTYYVSNSQDVVVETNADARIGGTDRVYSSLAAYTLGTNVENGRITTSTAANLTGNALANMLYAGTGSNVLDGGAGTDTVSYYYASAGVTLSLATTAAQATGGSSSDTLRNIEKLNGSNYADKLTGSAANNTLNGGSGNDLLSGGAGNDILNGGSGNDVLTDGLGADKLTGGTGADRFDFNSLVQLGLSSTTRDIITDFKTSQGDKIDLQSVDANSVLAGDQAFSFLGTVSAFSGNATGKLRFDAAAHILYGSTDADTTAEFAIVLTGVSSLTASSLVL